MGCGGLGYNSRVHETGNIWRVAGGQRVGCHSVVKKPRGFLKHINLGLRGAGNSDGRKDLGKRLGDHQAELALLQASKPRPNELREGENRGRDARSRVGGGPMGDRGPITRTWSDFFLRCACTGPPCPLSRIQPGSQGKRDDIEGGNDIWDDI